MEAREEIKQAKAKLYNLRSAIDGMVSMVEAEAMKVDQVGSAIVALSSKIVDELDKMLKNNQ